MSVGASRQTFLLLPDSTKASAEFVTKKVKTNVQAASKQDHRWLAKQSMNIVSKAVSSTVTHSIDDNSTSNSNGGARMISNVVVETTETHHSWVSRTYFALGTSDLM